MDWLHLIAKLSVMTFVASSALSMSSAHEFLEAACP
jgi:hypothetical protein